MCSAHLRVCIDRFCITRAAAMEAEIKKLRRQGKETETLEEEGALTLLPLYMLVCNNKRNDAILAKYGDLIALCGRSFSPFHTSYLYHSCVLGFSSCSSGATAKGIGGQRRGSEARRGPAPEGDNGARYVCAFFFFFLFLVFLISFILYAAEGEYGYDMRVHNMREFFSSFFISFILYAPEADYGTICVHIHSLLLFFFRFSCHPIIELLIDKTLTTFLRAGERRAGEGGPTAEGTGARARTRPRTGYAACATDEAVLQ